MIDTLVSKWDDPYLIGIFVNNLGKTSSLLGYVSTTEYIDPVELFIEKEPELASKLIIYWVNKPDGLKTVFEGMYKIVDTYAHNRTNKSVIVKIEKNYNEDVFKSLVGKKLSSNAVNAITEHFYGKQPTDTPTITPGTPKPPKMPKLPKGVYKEPKPPKPVKEPSAPKAPRKPKEPKVAPPTTTSLISGIERTAIRAGQAKLVAETEEASASTIQRAIKSRKARNVVAKMKADTASASTLQRAMRSKMARTTMAKMKADKEVISVPVPKTKRAKKVKPVYKMSYSQAVKIWNQSRGNAMWCSPKKNSDEYKAVQQLRL